MTKLAEVMDAITEQRKGTELLRGELKKATGDAVDQASFKKLEELVTDLDTKRQKFETDYLADIEATKKLAEEASLKAGRRGADGGDEPDADALAHKSVFVDFMRAKGAPSAQESLKEAEAKALGSATGSGPGVGVPGLLAQDIQKKVVDTSVMRGLIDMVTVGTSDYKKLVDKGGMGFGWVGAGDTRTATALSGEYEVDFPMGTLYAYPEVQEEQLDDVFFDLENWLIESARIAFANAIDVSVINGTGTKMPTGMLATAPVADADGARADKVYQYLASGTADTLGVPDNLIELIYLVKAQYRANARFAMNSLTTGKVRVMQDTNGRFLWADGLAVGEPARLLGYPVAPVEAMPDIAANSTPIGFGDFKEAYTMVERHELRITPDEITKPGFKKWHIRTRKGGAPTNDDAVKFIKAAAA